MLYMLPTDCFIPLRLSSNWCARNVLQPVIGKRYVLRTQLFVVIALAGSRNTIVNNIDRAHIKAMTYFEKKAKKQNYIQFV